MKTPQRISCLKSAHSMSFDRIRILTAAVAGVLCAWSSAPGVPLENWRRAYYEFAADLGLFSASRSGMFWDDLNGKASFASSLWPDSAAYRRNHWILEPALTGAASNEEAIDKRHWYWHVDLLNDLRFHNLLVRQTLDVDSRYGNDPRYVWKKDRFAAGRIEEAYAQIDWNWGCARLGRLKRNWGPFADRSLLLSSAPHAYDAIEWGAWSCLFEFRHLFGAFTLNRSTFDADNGAQPMLRFLTAHSLNIILEPWATVGITETVLFTRAKGLPDLQYINPISVYSVTNTNGEGDGNLMTGVQWTVRPILECLRLKGQLIIDDIQVDDKTLSDLEPSHWGIDCGLHWINPLSSERFLTVAKLEYRYLSRWLYTVADANGLLGERYTYLGQSLGYPATDGDRIGLEFCAAGKELWTAAACISYERKGSTTIQSSWSTARTWDSAAPGALGYRNETPLSRRKDVAQTIELSLKGSAYFHDLAEMRFQLWNRWVKSAQGSGFTYEPAAAAAIAVHYGGFFAALPQ